MSALLHTETQEQAFESALARGRLHHAWLLTGPEGLGKASFARRFALRLLGARSDTVDDPVVQLAEASAHPDLLILARDEEGGKKAIPVDEARRLPAFFAKAPSMGCYRVAIVDSADDLNVNAANAVLKTLEEPSANGVLFLISHAPGGLLPTIRSRCRRLRFDPWTDEALAAFLADRTGLSGDDLARLTRMARGAPGRGLALHASGALELDAAAQTIIEGLPTLDARQAQGLADRFRGAEGMARFELTLGLLADHAARMAGRLGRGGALWAQAQGRLAALPLEVEGINLDRTDALLSALNDLKSVARGSC